MAKGRNMKMADIKVLKARSAELAKSVRSIGKEIHTHLCDIMKHIASKEANGDVTPATHFLTLLMMNDKEGESRAIVRADAVKNWLEAYAFVTWSKDKAGKAAFKLNRKALDSVVSDNDAFRTHCKEAASNPWNVYTKAKAFTFFDLDAAIAALVKRAENAPDVPLELQEAGKHHKIPADKLAALKALAA
jgi:hypothetical protein